MLTMTEIIGGVVAIALVMAAGAALYRVDTRINADEDTTIPPAEKDA